MRWPHQTPPKMNKDTDNRLKKLDAAPSWILRLYEEIDSLNFGSGFDCFTSETEMVFGTANVKGTEAIKEFFIKIDSPINSKHRVHEFWDSEGVVSFHVDGRKVRAEAGTLIQLPRMVPHTFTVESEETRVINFYAPAGSEIHVISLARPAEERRRPTMEEGPPPKNLETNEILSRLYGSVAVTALPFEVQPTEELLVTKPDVWRAGTIKVARAEAGPAFDAFGLHRRLLAGGADTENNYDLFEVAAGDGAGMPPRILGADEAIYVLEGAVTVESDGQSIGGGIGSLTYVPAG